MAQVGPMLAPSKQFVDTRHYVRYPADVQPKLDGLRCLAYHDNGRIVLETRGCKEWDLPHLCRELAATMPAWAIWDGEIYIHGKSRQMIQRLIKSAPECLEFHVFDVVTRGADKPWSARRVDLANIQESPHVRRVRTQAANDESEIMRIQELYVADGYEGAMVRNLSALYLWTRNEKGRSNDLLKVKTFRDAEFTVVDFVDGIGKNAGVVTWVCRARGGRRFTVDPISSYAERREMFRQGAQYVGRRLTVRFQDFSAAGIPQFPKGVAFRMSADC